jgi:hypothetical protein
VKKANLKLTDEMCQASYGARADLWIEGFTLCRARCAIRCVERAYILSGKPSDRYDFVRKVLQQLDKQRSCEKPHPLHWEITAFCKLIAEGGKRDRFYAALMHTRAKRAIHKVMLGGRRG